MWEYFDEIRFIASEHEKSTIDSLDSMANDKGKIAISVADGPSARERNRNLRRFNF